MNGCCATLTSSGSSKVAFGGQENDLTLFDYGGGCGELKQVGRGRLAQRFYSHQPSTMNNAGVDGPERVPRFAAPASPRVCECGRVHR